jgi:glycosyltransferase involved in cell wall biosynthesis
VPGAELWIAGDGDLRPDLERLARKVGVSNVVRFYGHISDGEKECLIERCRCVALPSAGEGFGLVYLEAMRMGRPCLVSTVDAGREVVCPPEAGLAVNPGEPAAIASAIARLLTSGAEWEQWSEQARRRYAAHFTREHFHQRLLSALIQ